MDQSNNICLIDIKRKYGRERIYPANAVAEAFVILSGQKTLLREHLKIIQDLGFRVELIIIPKQFKKKEAA